METSTAKRLTLFRGSVRCGRRNTRLWPTMEDMNLLRLVARPLLAAPFLVDGFSALRSPSEHVDRAHAVVPLVKKLPPGLNIDDEDLRVTTRVLGVVMIGAGTAFALGKAPRTSAAILAGLAAPMAFVNAPVWDAESKEERFETMKELNKRLALVGALAIASMDRVGRPSAAWRRSYSRQHRRALLEARAAGRRSLAQSHTHS